jgi:cytochrome c-type biogenesis protein CcmF
MENGLMAAAAVFSGCAGLAALGAKSQKALALRRGLWIAAATLAMAAFSLMLYYLLTNRFEYGYVAQHSAKAQPALYKVSALWAGQEGSFLLWSAALSVTGLPLLRGRHAVCKSVRGVRPDCMFIFVLTAVSNPFARLYATPADGVGLTDALKNPWMACHPPLVFAAYSSMTVLAAHAAVFSEQTEEPLGIIQWWTRFSWMALGLGIFTGSIWAYNALGWGGTGHGIPSRTLRLCHG